MNREVWTDPQPFVSTPETEGEAIRADQRRDIAEHLAAHPDATPAEIADAVILPESLVKVRLRELRDEPANSPRPVRVKKTEAAVRAYLLKHGPATAYAVAEATGFSKGMVYRVLQNADWSVSEKRGAGVRARQWWSVRS